MCTGDVVNGDAGGDFGNQSELFVSRPAVPSSGVLSAVSDAAGGTEPCHLTSVVVMLGCPKRTAKLFVGDQTRQIQRLEPVHVFRRIDDRDRRSPTRGQDP